MAGPLLPILLGTGVVGTLVLLSKKGEAAAATVKAALPTALGPLPPLPQGFLPPTTPSPAGIITPASSISAVAGALGLPPSGVPQPPGTVAPTMQDLIDSLRDPANFAATHPNVSFDAVTDEQLQAAKNALDAQNVASAAAGQGQKARVTTNDPAPAGDLLIRVEPSDSAQVVDGGGAEKGGTVTIIELKASPDGVWSQIFWPGGSRRPAARGYAKTQFLTLL